MGVTRLNSLTSKIFLSTFAALFLLSFNSFARKIKFTTSSVVPAARGYVKISRDNNRNYIIKIQISELAEVIRLYPPRLTYVVWMVSDESDTMNMGQIKSSVTFWTKRLKASFETSTPYKPNQIFVTAEDDPSYQIPGAQMVLTTKRFKL
jgi:hypothetical protein